MPVQKRDLAREQWPAALVAVALVAPILIDTIAHPELATGILMATFAAYLLATSARAGIAPAVRPLATTLVALTGYLGLRSLFAPEPSVALFGAYATDSSLWLIAVSILCLLGASAWRARLDAAGVRPDLAPLLAVASLYAMASSVAAWQWGSTDGIGGPASGFTSNSQYQLQLLAVGIAASLAWAWMARSKPFIAAAALASAFVSAVGVYECRASATYPALAAAVAVGILLSVSARKGGEKWLAGLGTSAIVLLGGATVVMLSLPSTAGRVTALLDSLGGSRGQLWSSTVQVFAANPLFGRGLSHATAVTRWSLLPDTFDVTTTTDPHNLFLSMAIGGGIVALALCLAAAYLLQLSAARSVRGLTREEYLPRAILVSGAAAVFVISQFAFAYPVAWAVAAVLLGAAGALGPRPVTPQVPRKGKYDSANTRTPDTPSAPTSAWPVLAMSVTALALIAGSLVFVPHRIASLHLDSQSRVTPPDVLLDSQVSLITRSADVKPAGTALGILTDGLRSAGKAALPLVPSVTTATSRTEVNMRWDARLAVARLNLWSVAARISAPDADELQRIITAGIEADPGSGFWASSGAMLAARHDLDEQAVAYATQVIENPLWRAQLAANADSPTRELIEGLAR